MKRSSTDIDDVMSDLDEVDNRGREAAIQEPTGIEYMDEESKEGFVEKELVGNVEHFYDKIGVVAIALSGTLKVGDYIEVEDAGKRVRQRILSMQIDRKDVEEARTGDSVGIKVDVSVARGSRVYKLSA